jgi:hypothetical protein
VLHGRDVEGGVTVSDQIHLLIGAAPWLPSTDSELVEEYEHYDMPTAGVVSQSGCHFLFECVEGVVVAMNIWLYAPITHREEERLSRLSGPELAEAMDDIWSSRDVTVAIAADDSIRTGSTVGPEVVKRLGPRGAAISAVQRLLKEMDAGVLDAAH